MSLHQGDGAESLTVLYIATSIDPYNSGDHINFNEEERWFLLYTRRLNQFRMR